MGHIDWVNGGFHGEGVNMGLGKHFKSARERDNFAASQGLVRQDKYSGDLYGDKEYNRRKKKKEAIEARRK